MLKVFSVPILKDNYAPPVRNEITFRLTQLFASI
jgi:hypothetical protein